MPVNAPSSQKSEFGQRAAVPLDAARLGPADWSQMAAESTDLSDFLRRLAAQLRAEFDAGIVAIQEPGSDATAMLVVDEWLAANIDRDALKTSLRSISSLPTACNVATTVGHTRSIGIELQSAPNRSAVMVVFPVHANQSPAKQIEFLKRLQEIHTSVSVALRRFDTPTTSDVIDTDNIDTTASHRISAGDLSRMHLDLDLNATAYRIANETRRLLRADRVTVLQSKLPNYRVLAVSGVAVIDRRSNTVRACEHLCCAARVLGRGVVLPGGEDLPPQITEPLDIYLDESGVQSVVLLPLGQWPEVDAIDPSGRDVDATETVPSGSKQLGMIMLEYFAGPTPESLTASMELVRRDATLALGNAIEHRAIFGLPVWKALGRIVQSHHRVLWLAIASLAIAAIALGCVIPIDHKLVASGTMEPSVRQQVFANLDGTVKQINVRDGDSVKAGDVLIMMENAELQSQKESISGEIQTKLQRLASTRSQRLSGSGDVNRDSQLAIEERQFENELASLRTQSNIVSQMQSELTITSPMDGQVIAWQMEQRLLDRPIGLGNLLLSVVDPQSPWQLILEVADKDAGTVLASFESTGNLPIQFAVTTEPTRTYDAELVSISTTSRINESGQQVVDAIATVRPSSMLSENHTDTRSVDGYRDAGQRRVGSGVTAKIVCGRRSVWASWFSDVSDFVNRKVFFYFRS